MIYIKYNFCNFEGIVLFFDKKVDYLAFKY